MLILASSIGQPLARHLKRDPAARVCARFDSTVQLESDDGTLWAITTRANPAAMRVVIPSLPDWRDGAIVRAHGGKIVSDNVELSWDVGAPFDPVPRPRALSIAQRAGAVRAVADAITHWQLFDALGFWDALSEMWEPMQHVLGRSVFASPFSACPSGIARHGSLRSIAKRGGKCELVEGDASDEAISSAALNVLLSRLVGCGPGLTPAGDDFVQALLVTLRSGDANDRAAFETLSHAVAAHLSRTTRVSRAFLEQALHGWAFGALKDVLDALPLVTQDKMNALLRIGATSGPAYALGVLMGIL